MVSKHRRRLWPPAGMPFTRRAGNDRNAGCRALAHGNPLAVVAHSRLGLPALDGTGIAAEVRL